MFRLLQKRKKITPTTIPGLKQLYIELTNRCNLRCRMCARQFTRINLGNLQFSLFEKLLPVMRNCESVALNGWGESLVHPDFLHFLESIPVNGPRIEFTTNGMLLNDTIIAALTGLPSTLIISMDGATARTYEHIRLGSNYQQILGILETIKRIKNERGSSFPIMNIAFVAMRSNITELPDLINVLAEWDIAHLNVMFLVVHGEELLGESLYFFPQLYNYWIEKSRIEAERVGLSFSFPGIFDESRMNDSSRDTNDQKLWLKCESPFNMALIQYDGSVLPCCVTDQVMGSLVDEEFADIWSGKRFKEFRKSIRTANPSTDCLYCHQSQYQNIHNKSTHIKLLK